MRPSLTYLHSCFSMSWLPSYHSLAWLPPFITPDGCPHSSAKGSGWVMGSRSLETTSGRRDGWGKKTRLGDINGGDAAKEGPELLLSMSVMAQKLHWRGLRSSKLIAQKICHSLCNYEGLVAAPINPQCLGNTLVCQGGHCAIHQSGEESIYAEENQVAMPLAYRVNGSLWFTSLGRKAMTWKPMLITRPMFDGKDPALPHCDLHRSV